MENKKDYVIVANEKRKTATLLIKNVVVSYPTPLLKFENDKYWGNATIKCTFKDLQALIIELGKKLCEADSTLNIKTLVPLLYESQANPYALFRNHRNKDKEIVDDTFDISLSHFKSERDFFFKEKECINPIRDEEEIRSHTWVLELEVRPYIDEKTLETKIGSFTHRLVEGGKNKDYNPSFYGKNDDLWNGFNFDVSGDVDDEEEMDSLWQSR